jgi:hypothetical protein
MNRKFAADTACLSDECEILIATNAKSGLQTSMVQNGDLCEHLQP